MTTEIHPGTANDVHAVVTISESRRARYGRVFYAAADAHKQQTLRSRLDGKATELLLMRETGSGEVVAYCIFSPDNTTDAHIDLVETHQNHAGNRYGSQLVEALQKRFRRLTLMNTAHDRDAGARLYGKLGFLPRGGDVKANAWTWG